MKLTTVLFDLDGTLLPMDNDVFAKGYLRMLAGVLQPRGYEPEAFVAAMWKGVAAMVKNDGSRTNEQAFWDAFAGLLGEQTRADEPVFRSFYENEFRTAIAFCGFEPLAADTVNLCRELGLRTALATNPLFPAVATLERVKWAGLDPAGFELITTYEDTSFCKPNPDYYRDVCARLGVRPEECLMVGNDACEDMIAATLGMRVFLLTDCLINKQNTDIRAYPHGGFERLMEYIRLEAEKE